MVHEATKSLWTHPSIQKTRRKTEGQQRQEEKKYIDIISLIVVNIYAYQLFQLLKHNLHKYCLIVLLLCSLCSLERERQGYPMIPILNPNDIAGSLQTAEYDVVHPVIFVDYAIIAIDYIIAESENFSLLLSEQNDILLNHFP